MRTIHRLGNRMYPIRAAFPTVMLIAALGLPAANAQQSVKLPADAGPAMAQLHKAPGKLLTRGKNDEPVGEMGLKTYTLEEITLAQPLRIELNGLKTNVTSGWRLTLIGGPFPVRAMPAMIWADKQLLGYGVESPDLNRISVVTFDRSLLKEGAVIALSYGENDPSRTELPERLALTPNR